MVDKHANLEVKAVIAGNNPGRVFVDDSDEPISAVVWSQGNGDFYLMGSNLNPRFNSMVASYINDELVPDLHYTKIDISGTHKKWDATIEKAFTGKELKTSVQRVYSYVLKTPPMIKLIPKGYAIVPVDKKLLSSSLEHSAYVVEQLEKYWHSVRVFLHDGFAYCAIQGNSIASICFVSFISAKAVLLKAETFEGYKRQGLAQALTAECVKRALKDKVVPYWDCSATDAASVKIPEGLGFTKQWEYNRFSYKLD